MSERPLIWDYSPGALRDPVVVCSFVGWNDAGVAASDALIFLIESLGAERFAQVDPEDFFNLEDYRPRMKMVEGVTESVTWPTTTEIYVARMPEASRDLVLILGVEPSFRWRTFANVINELVDVLDASMFVSFGSFLAEVLHTQPTALAGAASDIQLIERMSIQLPSFEGPTGIVGVLHAACADDGIPAASIWAAIPYYLPSVNHPKAAVALIRELEAVAGITIDTTELEAQVSDSQEQTEDMARLNDEIGAIVERLERQVESEPQSDEQISSGEQLASEFQRFLEQQDSQDR